MKPTKTPLEPGEIVQLDPEKTLNRAFAGCLMVVTEPKHFGAQGYVQLTGEGDRVGGQAFYRAAWDEMEHTGGFAPWLIDRTE